MRKELEEVLAEVNWLIAKEKLKIDKFGMFPSPTSMIMELLKFKTELINQLSNMSADA